MTGRAGLRTLDARSGAAISIPTSTALFAAAAPFALDVSGFSLEGAMWFAAVGLFFPAIVTLLTFRSNEELGPTVTGAVSGTAPLFALLAAAWLLGEAIPGAAMIAAAGIVAGVAVLSWNQNATRPSRTGWLLLWPLTVAVVRGLAQAGAKAGLLLWPNPFAAGLIGYLVSSATVITAERLGRGASVPASKAGMAWFAATGVLNGCAVLLMYAALNLAPVALVAPVIATYPLVTALVSVACLHEEKLTVRMPAGAALIVGAIAYLVASRGG